MALDDARAVIAEVRLGYRTGILPLLEDRYPGEPDPLAFPYEQFEGMITQVDDLSQSLQRRLEFVFSAVEACGTLRRAIITEVASLLGVALLVPVGDGD